MFRKIIFVLGIVVLGMAFTIAGCKSKTVEQLYSEGVQQLQEGNPGGAIVLLKNALDKDQNHAEARYQLAKAYAAAGKSEQAEKEFQKVLRQNPSREEIKLELATIHCQLMKPELAIQEVNEYQKSHPGSPEALEILGIAYNSANNPGAAESCLLHSLQGEPSRISAKIELAGIYGAQGRNGEARRLLDDIIAKDPKNSKACYMLAALEFAEGNRDKALGIYRKLAVLYPSDSTSRYRSAMIYLDKGDLDKAAEIAEEIVVKFPNQSEGYRLRGIVSYHRRNFDDAITELQNSIKLQPSVEGYYFLGLSLYEHGELENALSQFRIIIDQNPSFVQARLLTGMILLSQKRVDDSVAEINKLLQIDGGNALAHNLLGSAYMAKGMYEEGLGELNRATELDPKLVEAHIRKGIFYLNRGNVKEAETDLRTAVKVRPELLNTRLILFSYYMQRNDRTKALSLLQEGLTGKKGDAVLYNCMAAVMFAENKTTEAMTCLQKAKVIDPAFLAPYFNTATFHAASGAYANALVEYGAVLQKEPKNLKAMLNIAAILELEGKESDALSWYNKARASNNPAAFIALANYYARKKYPDKAVSLLDEAIKTNPRNTDILELKGRILMSEKQYREALRVFDDIESITPDLGIPLKINAYVVMKEVPKAIEQARRIITLKPNSSYGYMMLASIYESQNDLDRGVEELKKGLSKEKENLHARLLLGNLYIRKKDYPLASATFAEALRMNPDSAPACFSQGTLLEKIDKKQEAVHMYRKALIKSDNYLPALNNLAYLYTEGYGNKKEGLSMALTAYKMEPGNGGFIDTLGYALLKNGRGEEARKVLEKASAILPNNPTVNFHLALACQAIGDRGRAVAILRKVLQLGDFPEETEAKTLLAQLK
ncbi:MAG: XrtA/PEP-CTERM system TPR-repeat protein PrsT [Geobacteraceae bacterium]